ncbi:MAG: riboflavin synthase [Candidatus Nealsonbacteria bacterium CG08_land_8_20_14_0_20_38_20]|uniref:Riboflavin synthase n=1 Tax=Candidatus Nealsonbacteria bacterium CG08_land_8_20_14_0_20_38_20 TaxID=1974705 RepID=A0A2H0YLS2_9BACT|nr:MAG: riboflavin synthase [Candidatus Nealsonbacteria bacterium CG08_land_8_20_14_0_20_38_20]
MFTGIITHSGKIKKQENAVWTISAPAGFLKQIKKGMSVALNGVCLTVLKKQAKDSFCLEIMPETKKRTNFSDLKINDFVNLELPLKSNSFLSGHFVQGHIDGTGILREIKKQGNGKILKIGLPQKLIKYLVEKGSVAINGISLTVIGAGRDFFTVGIIPWTWQKTNLSRAKIGDKLNIEVDILAKYLKKLLKK